MPEGDTVARTARTLDRVLRGQTILRVAGSAPPPSQLRLLDRAVREVRARGKNLLLHVEGGASLVTHLGMTGSWHVYRPGESWQKPERLASVVFGVARADAVAFSVPNVEWCATRELPLHPRLRALGPDLLDPDFDAAEAARRLRLDPARPIGEALLDQRAVAGIGNVYKSECLFVAGLDPFAPVRAVDDAALDRLLDVARRLMGSNLRGYPRTTCPDAGPGGAWVYGRSGRSCRRCGRRIRMRRQGEAGRSTYWCASCQAPRPGIIRE